MGVRHYTLQLTTVGPVHIGSGRKLGKKDYYYPDKEGKEIAVLDAEKFVGGLSQISQNQLDAYVRFLETNSNKSLKDFLEDYPDLEPLAQESILYRVSTNFGQKKERGKEEKPKYFDVDECMKDIRGCPYVPGSSIKGMLRTAILAFVLDANPEDYAADAQKVQSGDRDKMKAACKDIEHAVFKESDSNDPKAPNDIMRYISVSDSAPLSTDDLVFAQKYDKFSKLDNGRHKRHKKYLDKTSDADYRKGNELNIYRECLKPGTQFKCSISIDERIDQYLEKLDTGLDADGLRRILRRAAEIYNERFLSSFDLELEKGGRRGSLIDEKPRCQFVVPFELPDGVRHIQCKLPPAEGSIYCERHRDQIGKGGCAAIPCYLGGGVGFSSKTVLNALFPEQNQRVNAIARTLDAQFPTKKTKGDHRHWKDPEFGVSPHTVKLAIVGKKKYLMGECEIEIME